MLTGDINLEKLKKATNNASSFSQVMENLGYSRYNSRARKIVKDLLITHQLNVPHGVGKRLSAPIDVNTLLCVTDIKISTSFLKRKILQANLLEEKCMMPGCNLSTAWNNKTLKLHLDHRNGDPYDNRIENLRLLCPNCHSQTDTYTAKNVRKNDSARFCERCNEISTNGKYCSACKEFTREPGGDQQMKFLPSAQQLEKDIKNLTISGVARKYNISRSTVYARKRTLGLN